MLKVSVFIAVSCLLIGAGYSASVDCSIDECRKPMKIYEELGCKPTFGSKSCCPKRYECPDDVKFVKDENKCTFKGSEYEIGDFLPRSLTNESKCLETCICSRNEDEPAQFLCTSSDCGISSFKVPGCINIYGDLNECCSTSIICDDDEKENLATCWDGDVKYHEGEKFRSKSNPCYECLCHQDFDNTTIIENNSQCHKLNCEIELKYKSFVQRGCLPIFENDKCCPVDWKCFDSAKKGKKVVKRATEESEHADSTSIPSQDDDVDANENSVKETTTDAIRIDSTTEVVEDKTLEVTKIEDKSVPSLATSLMPPHEVETTTSSIESEKATEISSEATVTATTEEITTISSTETDLATEQVATTETITVPTTESVSTTKLTTESVEKDSSSSEEDSDEENLFGEDIDSSNESEEKIASTKESPAATSTAALTTESSTQASTTEITTEEATTVSKIEGESEKSLDEPEKETTISDTEITTPEVSTEQQKSSTIEEKPKTTEATYTLDQKLSLPVPTSLDTILTAIKDLQTIVSKLNFAETTKSTEEAEPASFVNFTVSRSLPISLSDDAKLSKPENEAESEVENRSKRSADAKAYYLKYSNKEKGCLFGTTFYKTGDVINTDNKCLECFCYYSPIGHCVRKDNCSRN